MLFCLLAMDICGIVGILRMVESNTFVALLKKSKLKEKLRNIYIHLHQYSLK